MTMPTRRQFAVSAATIGAALAIAGRASLAKVAQPTERRDLFPQGVASGDPTTDSVILWTRRPPDASGVAAQGLTVEVADRPDFRRIVARGDAPISAGSDWTCRFLAAGLRPRREYWYRFIDEFGFCSRIGRTLTAGSRNDKTPVRFAFVSCQLVPEGACNAYRRMIFEDEAASPASRLDFVLHLGDFIYEVVWYPEDSPGGVRRSRRLHDIVRYPDGEKLNDFHLPTTLADYRVAYSSYLLDPDLQDARARWPFVCVWDNHEFSWAGWQSQQIFGGSTRPAQTKKVAANQAWWEYIPARVAKPGDPAVDIFVPPAVTDQPIDAFDESGLGLEPNNLTAVNSLKINRALRWGRNVELILTDNHSFRSKPVDADFSPEGFRWAQSQRVSEILDSGRAYRGYSPPETIEFAGATVPNPNKNAPPQSFLGADQKRWLLGALKDSQARWKIWGHSFGTLEWRSDYQNLPPDFAVAWPDEGYALLNGGFYVEKAEIFDFVRDNEIEGFAIVAGDRHSFWAGLVSKALPPQTFEPVGVEFITGSISSPGIVEVAEQVIPRDEPDRALFLYDRADGAFMPAMNVSALHGVRSALELSASGDIEMAKSKSNSALSPHLKFLDLSGHGYGVITASHDAIDAEFVCIPRPLERAETADGGPLLYRVRHRSPYWRAGEQPVLIQQVLEGDVSYNT